jgi:hypothetical protein
MKLSFLSILLVQFLAVSNSISAQQSSPTSFAYVLQADSLAKSKTEAMANPEGG